MRDFKSIFVSSKHKINCFLIQEKYFQTANAVDTLPRQHRGGVDVTSSGFSGISFLFTGRMSPFFSIAYQPSFLSPPLKFQDPDPLNFHL